WLGSEHVVSASPSLSRSGQGRSPGRFAEESGCTDTAYATSASRAVFSARIVCSSRSVSGPALGADATMNATITIARITTRMTSAAPRGEARAASRRALSVGLLGLAIGSCDAVVVACGIRARLGGSGLALTGGRRCLRLWRDRRRGGLPTLVALFDMTSEHVGALADLQPYGAALRRVLHDNGGLLPGRDSDFQSVRGRTVDGLAVDPDGALAVA